MTKKWISSILCASIALVLSGCGNPEITTTKKSYSADGMVAIVKGSADHQDHLTYQIDNGKKHSVKVSNKTFVISVPLSTKQQTVTLKANKGKETVTKKVTVKKANALGKYSDISKKYNQVIVMSHLSNDEIKTLKLAEQIKNNPTEMMKNATQLQKAQQVQQKMAQLQTTTKKQQLPTNTSGIKNLIKDNVFTLRANVQNGQMVGATMIIPTKTFKNKDQMKTFGTSFMALSQAVGADGQQVMKDFEKETKSQNKTQTTSKTIKSNGVKYSIGFSKTELYIYISKE